MLRIGTLALAIGIAAGTGAFAETHEVQMLNRGEAGTMVFEPAQLRVAPGDTVRFVAADGGHNAETIDGMIPDGAEAFSGRINEEIEVTLTEEGLYAIRCTPHYAMGMVMTIAVGDAEEVPQDFFEGRIPPRAMERLEAQLDAL
jgi:pseudoazurin